VSAGSLLSLPWQMSVAWPIHRLEHSLQPAQAMFSRVIGAASTLPWPDSRQNAASPAERPVWPVVAAAVAGAFLSAETMALGSLQVRTEASPETLQPVAQELSSSDSAAFLQILACEIPVVRRASDARDQN